MIPLLLRMAGVGALIGLLGDRIHVYAGVLSYPNPMLYGQAWWVPFLFAGSAVVIGLHVMASRARLSSRAGASADAAVAWFVAAYLATGVFPSESWLGPALAALALARFAQAPSPGRAAVLGGVAVGGPLVEWSLQSAGAFTYQISTTWGVPSWLPALYLYVGDLAWSLADRWMLGPLRR